MFVIIPISSQYLGVQKRLLKKEKAANLLMFVRIKSKPSLDILHISG
uniref:Uncharacterized protein n=1 Tax=Rhizophora mucronata TaxID=61149 RepID=A0A2P2KEU2_RHIMU